MLEPELKWDDAAEVKAFFDRSWETPLLEDVDDFGDAGRVYDLLFPLLKEEQGPCGKDDVCSRVWPEPPQLFATLNGCLCKEKGKVGRAVNWPQSDWKAYIPVAGVRYRQKDSWCEITDPNRAGCSPQHVRTLDGTYWWDWVHPSNAESLEKTVFSSHGRCPENKDNEEVPCKPLVLTTLLELYWASTLARSPRLRKKIERKALQVYGAYDFRDSQAVEAYLASRILAMFVSAAARRTYFSGANQTTWKRQLLGIATALVLAWALAVGGGQVLQNYPNKTAKCRDLWWVALRPEFYYAADGWATNCDDVAFIEEREQTLTQMAELGCPLNFPAPKNFTGEAYSTETEKKIESDRKLKYSTETEKKIKDRQALLENRQASYRAVPQVTLTAQDLQRIETDPELISIHTGVSHTVYVFPNTAFRIHKDRPRFSTIRGPGEQDINEIASAAGFGPKLYESGNVEIILECGNKYYQRERPYEWLEKLYPLNPEQDFLDTTFLKTIGEQVENMLEAGFSNEDVHWGNVMKRTVPAKNYDQLRTKSARIRAQTLAHSPETENDLVSEWVFADNDHGLILAAEDQARIEQGKATPWSRKLRDEGVAAVIKSWDIWQHRTENQPDYLPRVLQSLV